MGLEMGQADLILNRWNTDAGNRVFLPNSITPPNNKGESHAQQFRFT